VTTVLDASALLAFLLDAPGQDQVDRVISEAVIAGGDPLVTGIDPELLRHQEWGWGCSSPRGWSSLR
jgi:PIN domain nuclease of toxin-antitoxin system